MVLATRRCDSGLILILGSRMLEAFKIARSIASKILEGANEILKSVPVVKKRWTDPW